MKTINLFGIKLDIYKRKHNPQPYIQELESFAVLNSNIIIKKGLYPLIQKHAKQKHLNTKIKSIVSFNNIYNAGGAARIAVLIANTAAKLYTSSMFTDKENKNISSNVNFYTTTTEEEKKLCAMLNTKTGLLDFFFLHSLELKHNEVIKNSDVFHFHNLHGEYFSPFALPELTALKPSIWTLHDTCSFTGHCGNFMDCSKWEKEECKECPYVSLYQQLPFDTAHEIYKTKEKIYENMADDVTLVAPSQWLINKVKKSILSKFDIRLIPNGIDNTIYKPYDKQEVRKELKLPQNKKILLFSCHGGTESSWKGGEYITQVYNTFRDRSDIFFLVIGGNKREYISENYIQLPYVTDETELAKYYSASDLLIYPSKADNHPLVILEALGCSLPVITFNTGGIPEIIEQMKTGYIAPQFDINDFISGINIFLKDDKLREYAGILGRKEVEEKYTKDLMNKRYLDLYEEVFERRKQL